MDPNNQPTNQNEDTNKNTEPATANQTPDQQPASASEGQSSQSQPGQSFSPQSSQSAQPTEPVPTQPSSSPAVTQPAAPAEPTAAPASVSSNFGPATLPPEAKKSKKKPLLISLAVFLVLLLGAAGFIFIYLPSTPNGTYALAMNYSNRAYDKLAGYATSVDKKHYQGDVIDGSFDFSAAGAAGDGTITSKSNGLNSDSTIDLNIIGQKFSLNSKSIAVKGQTYPDYYVQVNGVKTVLQSYGYSKYAALDGQWIAIDHTILQGITDQLNSSKTASELTAPTDAQIKDALTKVGQVNRKYLFTTSQKNGVLQKQKFLGKSKQDGRTVYGYQMGYSKDNLKAYSAEVVKALNDSSFNSWIKTLSNGKSISELVKTDDLNKQINSLKSGYTFTMYIDGKTKLIHQLHFTDTTDPINNYLNFGLNYTGGDLLPFVVEFHSKDTTGSGTIKLVTTLNTKTDKATIDFGINGTSSGSPIKVNAKLNITPSNDPVQVTAPANSVPIVTVLGNLGLGDLLSGSSGSSSTPNSSTLNSSSSSSYNNFTFTQ